ncbi:LysR substrate-binding domain-containing protein [Nocardioides sp. B-3]|uniref:LysR substrate-binding domain-containing protein n=1 Tax=Nocardioides sp. B-3 TaxID=2895565 RepID=UPI0021538E2D|nr:LysR substrate-binding domain-containing protein [Nocardioides sp. B-3]UUZ60195.1 LysR substrate-binding domain-containing protein [Nocardioides sp. B-3]
MFARAADGVHLTPIGELVATGAREVVARYDQLVVDVRGALDPESGVARLAFLDSMATSLVPQLLREFHAVAPRVRVLLSREPSHELEADPASGAVDLAISSRRSAGHGWHLLQEERLVVAVPPTHRLAGRSRLRPADRGGGAGHHATRIRLPYARRLAAPGGRGRPRDLVREPGPATIEGLVAAGLGVAIVPEAMVGLSGTHGIQIVGSPGARRSIGLTRRTDRKLPPAAERLRASIVAGTANH